MPGKILIKLSLKVVPHPICVTVTNISILLIYCCSVDISWLYTHTHTFNGPFSGTTRVSWYQKKGR